MKLRNLLLTILLAAFVTTGVVGGAVAVKKANAETVAKFTDVQLNISESLTMKYIATLPENAENVKAVFTLGAGDKVVGESTITPTVADDGRYVFSFKGITPQHMDKTVSAVVTYTLGGEEKTFDSTGVEYDSVKAYLTALLTKTAEELKVNAKVDEAIKKLAVDMLNYGAVAQTYKGVTENLVNAALTDEQKALATSFESVKNSVKSVLKRSDETTTVDWKSATLVFDNTLELKVKFAVADGYENLKVYANENQARLVKDETGTYSAYIAVAATEYDKEVVFAVKNGEENVGSSLTYSVASYINKYLSATEETAMSALAKQAYVYGKSVESYAEALTYVKLTLSGATFADNTTETYLKPGAELPTITGNYDGWYNVNKPTEFYMTTAALEGAKSNAKEFAMPAEDTTISPLSFTSVKSCPRKGGTDYYVTANDETYTEELYGKLSQTRTLYKINDTTVKAVSGFGYVLTSTNGAWASHEGSTSGPKYYDKDRIFTRTFTNYGQTTMKFSYRHEYYNNRFFESETIELAPGETYVYVYYVPMAWLSTRVSNSTTTFELYFGETQISYETVLVHTAKAAVLSTAN